ncbi:WD40 repeat-like protein [Paxillus ammoniavirescens]|nr:WD40 repeat-like protein [Paxillus ammoniavirescens]
MVVSGSNDKTVGIWNGASGERIHVLEGHEHWVLSVGFSPDSSRVVSGSRDRTIRVWSVETGALAFEPIKCRGWVECVRHAPGGDRIASGGTVGDVQIWDARTGVGIRSITDSTVNSLAWTPDGTSVIGGRMGQVTIWCSINGEPLWSWKAHNDWIHTLSISSNGTHLVTSNWHSTTAFVSDILTGERIAALEHKGNVNRIAYSPSGKFIATACDDRTVYLWEAPIIEDLQNQVIIRWIRSTIPR